MEVKFSDVEIRAIAVQVAQILRDEAAPKDTLPNEIAEPVQAAGHKAAASSQDEPKPRASRVLTPEEAVSEFPSLTVRTIKRAITEGRLEPSEPGQTTVRRTELKRFVASRA